MRARNIVLSTFLGLLLLLRLGGLAKAEPTLLRDSDECVRIFQAVDKELNEQAKTNDRAKIRAEWFHAVALENRSLRSIANQRAGSNADTDRVELFRDSMRHELRRQVTEKLDGKFAGLAACWKVHGDMLQNPLFRKKTCSEALTSEPPTVPVTSTSASAEPAAVPGASTATPTTPEPIVPSTINPQPITVPGASTTAPTAPEPIVPSTIFVEALEQARAEAERRARAGVTNEARETTHSDVFFTKKATRTKYITQNLQLSGYSNVELGWALRMPAATATFVETEANLQAMLKQLTQHLDGLRAAARATAHADAQAFARLTSYVEKERPRIPADLQRQLDELNAAAEHLRRQFDEHVEGTHMLDLSDKEYWEHKAAAKRERESLAEAARLQRSREAAARLQRSREAWEHSDEGHVGEEHVGGGPVRGSFHR